MLSTFIPNHVRLILAAALVMCASSLAHADNRSISTSGKSVIYVAPDEAIINLGVNTFNASLEQAKADNDALSASLLKAIRRLHIPEEFIQASRLDVSIRYQHMPMPNTPPQLVGYDISRTYQVTLKELTLLEKLLDVSLTSGANSLSYTLHSTESRKYRDEARRSAMQAAKEKAEELAQVVGCRVGYPKKIQEQDYSSSDGFLGSSLSNTSSGVAGSRSGGSTMPMGKIKITASVTATFDLEPLNQPANSASY